MKGLIEIYCGDGKGKTTASIGLAIRAAGSGMHVLLARFLKNDSSSELCILNNIPNIEVIPCTKSFGFYSNMNDITKKEASIYYTNLLSCIINKTSSNKYSMLILDEIIATCNYSLVDEKLLINLLDNKPSSLEIVLTGRNPSPALTTRADYISEIKKIKHPYDNNILARKGIEY